MESIILSELDSILSLGLPKRQKEYFQYLKESHKKVQCCLLTEVFTAEEIQLIKKVVRPKPKQCYKNAAKLVELFPNKVKYVEGKVMKWFPMEHAFNLVDGKYVDLTFELVLKDKEVPELEYASFLELDYSETIEFMFSTRAYGEWIQKSFENSKQN